MTETQIYIDSFVPGLKELYALYSPSQILKLYNNESEPYVAPIVETYTGQFEFHIENEYLDVVNVYQFFFWILPLFLIVSSVIKWQILGVSVVEQNIEIPQLKLQGEFYAPEDIANQQKNNEQNQGNINETEQVLKQNDNQEIDNSKKKPKNKKSGSGGGAGGGAGGGDSDSDENQQDNDYYGQSNNQNDGKKNVQQQQNIQEEETLKKNDNQFNKNYQNDNDEEEDETSITQQNKMKRLQKNQDEEEGEESLTNNKTNQNSNVLNNKNKNKNKDIPKTIEENENDKEDSNEDNSNKGSYRQNQQKKNQQKYQDKDEDSQQSDETHKKYEQKQVETIIPKNQVDLDHKKQLQQQQQPETVNQDEIKIQDNTETKDKTQNETTSKDKKKESKKALTAFAKKMGSAKDVKETIEIGQKDIEIDEQIKKDKEALEKKRKPMRVVVKIFEDLIEKYLVLWVILVYLTINFGSYAYSIVIFFITLLIVVPLNILGVTDEKAQGFGHLIFHFFIVTLYITYFIVNQQYTNLAMDEEQLWKPKGTYVIE